jgi:uncharacterized protein involved in exopolysaccharide biosynthesis
MSTEFRQRSAGDYFEMLKRRKWQILLPTVSILLAFAWVVFRMPDVYESTTLLTIKTPVISEKVAPSLTDANLSQRLQTISQNVLSRTSLEPLVLRYDLYSDERASGVPIDDLLFQMRKNITVELEKVNEEKVAGLRLTVRGSTPENARNVAAELANKYIAAQNIESTQSAETTKEFIDNQLAQAKNSLNTIENERLRIMSENVETLPESGQGLIAQLEGLRKREETIAKDRETLITEKGRVQDSIRMLNGQSRLIDDYSQSASQDAIQQAARIEDTPAYGQLIQKRAELTAKLENLKKQYREKHPEVIQTQTDIKSVNDEIAKLSKSADQRISQASQSLARKAELQKKSLDLEKNKATNQIDEIEKQLAMKDQESRQNSAQIVGLEAKINTIPNVKVALEGVENQYQSAKTNYDELMKKYNAAQGQVDREANMQGESIRVVDPANLPQTPANRAKKPLLAGLGGGLGLLIGLILAGFSEVPKLFKIQDIDDAKHYIRLPVLATVPPILTEQEIEDRRLRHQFRFAFGTAASIMAIPLIIIILEGTRILERLS